MNQYQDHADTQIDAATQANLNKPPIDPTGFNDGDKEFIQSLKQMIMNGAIDVMVPSSLIKQDVYANSSELAQGKADFVAVNLCSKLRDLENLMHLSGGDDLYVEPTYQVQMLVADLKYRKEQFEQTYGDLFKF